MSSTSFHFTFIEKKTWKTHQVWPQRNTTSLRNELTGRCRTVLKVIKLWRLSIRSTNNRYSKSCAFTQTAGLSNLVFKCRLNKTNNSPNSYNSMNHLSSPTFLILTALPNTFLTYQHEISNKTWQPCGTLISNTHWTQSPYSHAQNYCVAFFKATGERFLWLLLSYSRFTPSHMDFASLSVHIRTEQRTMFM